MKSGSGRFALIVVCLLLARATSAGEPTGAYAVDIGGENEIWFPSGDHTFCDTEGADSICLLTSASTDAAGTISGTGELQLHFTDLLDANMPGEFSGKISGPSRNPNARITGELTGHGVLHGGGIDIPVTVTGTAKLRCRNPLVAGAHSSTFQCRGPLKLCLEALGMRKSCHTEVVPAEVGAVGGAWNLALDLATGPKGALDGGATATLANGAFENFEVAGKYNARQDQSTLRLRLPGPGLRDHLTLTKFRVDDMGGVEGAVISFKVAGQTGRAVIPPPP